MKFFNRSVTLVVMSATIFIMSVDTAFAQRRFGGRSQSFFSGTSSLGIGGGVTSSSQDDINGAIDDANTATSGGISTKNLGNAWEVFVNWVYRFDRSSSALVFRPSYFFVSTDGNGSDGSYDYKLDGFTFFPMYRLYALENLFIRFFFQGGLGYGVLNGDIQAGSKSFKFKGSAFGAVGGIGADFCFTESSCITIEGNLRYLPIERNLTTSGDCASLPPGITQCGGTKEVERNNADLQTSMSGVQGLVSYTLHF